MDRIDTVKELPFRVGFTGHSGHIRIEPLPPVQQSSPINSLPEFILPPAFARETPESIKTLVEDKYLLPRLDPDEFSAENSGRQWEFEWFDQAKIHLEPTLPRSVVVPAWELPFRRPERASELEKWEPASVQVDVSELMVEAENSIGVRISGPPKDFVKGSINNRPFRPGGLDDSQSMGRTFPEGASNGEWVREVLNGAPAQVIPPSFKEGMDLGELKGHPCSWIIHEDQSVPKTTSESTLSVQFDDLFKRAWEEDVTELAIDGETSELEIEVIEAGSPKSISPEVENKSDLPVGALDSESSVIDQILSTGSEGLGKGLDDSGDGGRQQPNEAKDDSSDGGRQQPEAKVWAVTGGSDGIADHFDELVPDMALDFPFELDAFQKEAIYYLEKGESVFVAAHTSAGKTVVAEYAFALASKHCTRAVYTAPIKTISNQKYRDFSGKFDVGLLTGDVSLRPEASCLIMTTEILRSMLYRGADIIRDIEWVIFDEVHYVNDVERGVVWEEVIIMLPRHINFVLLSATVPNTIEFADWIGRTKQKQIRVTGTTKRPVPLEHCLFYSGELYKICELEKFIPQGLKAAKDVYKRKNMGTPVGGGSGTYPSLPAAHASVHSQKPNSFMRGKQNRQSGPQNLGNFVGAGRGNQNYSGGNNNWGSRISEKSLWLSLINKLSKTSLLPVVIFCFSKNRCDKSADNLRETDLTSRSEKSEIRIFCDKAFSRLKGSDRNLPQIVRVQGLLHRGIGVHHAGLLPIVKEVVEMLFCRGVIKILFSTETFAMGVNAPARTVVFDTVRKFDGKEFRQLLPGEYTQMAGRAGRRGLDNIGTVLVMCRDEIPEESDLKLVITGSATRLESQFRLTYIMILHLLRVEELKVEDMLKRSFAEFHAQKKLPEQQQLLMRKLSQPTKVIECIKGEPAIEDYYGWYLEAEMYSNQITETIMQSSVCQPFLMPGRVVVVKSQSGEDHLLGVILKAPSSSNNKQYIVMMLTPSLPATLQSSSSGDASQKKTTAGIQILIPKSKRGMDDDYYSSATARKGTGVVNIKMPHRGSAAGANYEVREIDTKEFLSICNAKIKIDQVGLLENDSNAAYSKTVQNLLDKKSNGNKYPPALDPLKDLKLKDLNLVEVYYRWNNLLQKMSENKCHNCVKLGEHIKIAREIRKYKEEVNALKFQMSDEALKQMPDFQGRIDVLKEIGCIDTDLVVQIKGRVACEMNSGEELICTECLFENQLDDLEPEEAVALMSAFVFQQRNASEPSLTPRMSQAKQRLHDTAIKLGELQAHFKIQIDPHEYARENLKFGLVEVVYEWAKGTPFADICELTDVPEGLIVRTIVRLDETCREFKNAAAIMGNSALCKKMEAASNAIKRDIVFAASLYITGL
ncbi:DExH-box ATP-dependent RNA helicase DExH11 isoform X1 [Cynara cardunculus var. scolymus]|uniref:DExH-box ATP-dependent RNA helicase DExH11 isoform X1 n=2 Tax=Cynara cardunculus var. scolymus TaxID=59895 RepID=UPI000D628958|nr:DExH-box ATP-dependent RNA helicase DExH11 isoform X1 [Cynara cardunculus var. scolymus]